jgi:glycine/D-amino acid oxidase-like deaminating enzyme
MDADYAIVGGGVVGMAVAYGLQKLGKQVLVLDEGDSSLRASRGNFGLVWVQGKGGVKAPHYAQWSQRSASLWRTLADDLQQQTGIDLHLQQIGGFEYHTNAAELQANIEEYEAIKQAVGGNYPFEVLHHDQLKIEEPAIGDKVIAAILHQQDGHVNPLFLLRALYSAFQDLGGQLQNDDKVASIQPLARGFQLQSVAGKKTEAQKVILCAGLGASEFTEALGFKAEVSPLRGQNLVTEKLPRFINRPSGVVRQVNEGGVQIGDSKENVGFDDGNTLAVAAKMAKQAIDLFPILGKARMVRHWGALRVMSKDGLPIYAESSDHTGAFLITCHSGITLAAAHALLLPLWLEESNDAPCLEKFHERRFDATTTSH